MHDGIGLEHLAGPQVGSHVGIRRRRPGTVYQGEGILAHTGQWLGQQYDIAQLYPRHRQILHALAHGGHVLARTAAVAGGDCLAHRGREFLGAPAVVILRRHQGRFPRGEESGHIARGIGPQHRALALDQRLESFEVSRQALYPVSGIAQDLQGVIERVRHFQAAGGHGVHTRALVIVNGQFLVRVGHALERYPLAHHSGEFLHALGDGLEYLVAVFVGILGGDGVGSNGAVKLRQHHGHGDQRTGNALLVVEPLVVILENREGAKQRYIALPQPGNGLLRLVEGYPAVRHEHHRVGIDLAQKCQALVEGRHGIDIETLVRQRADKCVDMVAVGVERTGYRGHHRHPWLARLVKAIGDGVFLEPGNGLEQRVLVQVKHQVLGQGQRVSGRIDEHLLAVEYGPGVVQQ